MLTIGQVGPAVNSHRPPSLLGTVNAMPSGIRYSSTTLACPDPSALAAFYARLTDGEVTFVHEEWATVRCEGAQLEFMRVLDYRAPRWPDDSSLVHIDFFVNNLEEAAAHAVRAGARRFDHQPNFAHCLVLADPAGHPFCLSLIDEVG